jgi:hypothetical protein
MAYTALTTQAITRSGLEPSMTAAAAAGNYFENDERTVLRVMNGDGSDITVSISYGRRVDGATLTDTKDVVVPDTTGDVFIGPFPKADYDQPIGSETGPGTVNVDFSAVTSVTVAAIRI